MKCSNANELQANTKRIAFDSLTNRFRFAAYFLQMASESLLNRLRMASETEAPEKRLWLMVNG